MESGLKLFSGMIEHRKCTLLAVVTVLAIAAGYAHADDESIDSLLRNARMWEMKNNPESERTELIKLLNAAPNHAQGLLMRGELEIRSGNADLAQELSQRLKLAHPGSPEIAQLEEALRLAGKDSKKLAMVRLLVRAGKIEQAAAGMRSLFPNGAPLGNDLALEYYGVIGSTPKGWEETRKGLEKLVKLEPDDWRFQIALAQHLAHRPATSHAGIRMLSALAKRPDIDHQQIIDAWQQSLLALDRSPGNIGLYREYLAADPKNTLVRNALEGAQQAEAERQPWILRDKADALLSEGRVDEAKTILMNALQMAPKNPWVRFDLARLYHKRGSSQQGRVLMEEGLAEAPNDPEMLHACALYLGGMDEASDALRLLEKIPAAEISPSIKRLRQKMSIQAQSQQAKELAKSGQRDKALVVLEHAGVEADSDAELVNDVANALLEMGEPARGLALMRRLLAQLRKPPMTLRLRYALWLNRAEQDAELAPLLVQLSNAKELSGTDKDDLRYMRASLAARQADNLRHAGNYGAARDALSLALKQDPDNPDLLMAMVRVHLSANEPEKAKDIYQRLLERTPNDLGLRLSLMWALNDMNDQVAAQREAQTILTDAARDDINTRLSVADWYLSNKDAVFARRIIDPLREAEPDNQRVLIMLGRISKAEGEGRKALAYFKQAKADAEIASMENSRASYVVTAGIDYLSKSDGVPGISNLTLIEMPVELRMPVGYAGDHAFIQVDPVSASAGTLSLGDLYNLRQFGKVLAQPQPPTGIASALDQSAHGNALGVGYEAGDIRLDIGTTPLGFPVSDVVGGIKWSHYTESSGYSLDISRRPLTSTLLAYAGMSDPVTGEVWGGVRSNGVSLHVSRDIGRLSPFADAGYYVLTGQNVMTNTELALRTGADWGFIQDESMRLTAGLALTYWSYAENLRYYTFGHGGYYSPQEYYSLAIPFRWTGRKERWSYLLKGSLSASKSYEKDMDFYPTNSVLQAQATANSSFMTPKYTGGNGSGTGFSLGGALEYKVSPHLFVGGRFDIDRAEYYSPNSAVVYLRYLFDAHSGPLPYPPDPVKPYTRY